MHFLIFHSYNLFFLDASISFFRTLFFSRPAPAPATPVHQLAPQIVAPQYTPPAQLAYSNITPPQPPFVAVAAPVVSTYVTPQSPQSPPPAPSLAPAPAAPTPAVSHFPLVADALLSYREIKYDVLLNNLVKFNTETPSPLTADEMAAVRAVCNTLADPAQVTQSSSTVSAPQFAALKKMLDWPLAHALPGLNVWRVLPFHSHAGQMMKLDFPAIKSKLKAFVVEAKRASNSSALSLLCRIVCNMFCHAQLGEVVAAAFVDVIDPRELCSGCRPEDAEIKSWISAALNCISVFHRMKTKGAIRSEHYEIVASVLSTSLGSIHAKPFTPDTMYRLLQCVGACCASEYGALE